MLRKRTNKIYRRGAVKVAVGQPCSAMPGRSLSVSGLGWQAFAMPGGTLMQERRQQTIHHPALADSRQNDNLI
jgi:hypothetical protein